MTQSWLGIGGWATSWCQWSCKNREGGCLADLSVLRKVQTPTAAYHHACLVCPLVYYMHLGHCPDNLLSFINILSPLSYSSSFYSSMSSWRVLACPSSVRLLRVTITPNCQSSSSGTVLPPRNSSSYRKDGQNYNQDTQTLDFGRLIAVALTSAAAFAFKLYHDHQNGSHK